MSEEEDVSPSLLSADLISEGLGEVCECLNGEGWAYTTLSVPGRNLKSLGTNVSNYVNLRHVDFSHNEIEDVSELSNLPDLISINLSKNEIQAVPLFDKQNRLRVVQLNDNKLADFPVLAAPKMALLSLSGNQIKEVGAALSEAESLTELVLARNDLTSFELQKALPALRTLDLSSTGISSLNCLDKLPNLETLILQGNEIQNLDFMESAFLKLRVLDLSSNKLADLSELNKLQRFPHLRSLTLTGHEEMYEEHGEDLVKEVMVILPLLRKFDGVDVPATLRKESADLRREREEARQQAEEEARAAAAEEVEE